MNGKLEMYEIFRKRVFFEKGPEVIELHIRKPGQSESATWAKLDSLKIDDFHQKMIELLNTLEEKDGGGKLNIFSLNPKEDSSTTNPQWIAIARRRQ